MLSAMEQASSRPSKNPKSMVHSLKGFSGVKLSVAICSAAIASCDGQWQQAKGP